MSNFFLKSRPKVVRLVKPEAAVTSLVVCQQGSPVQILLVVAAAAVDGHQQAEHVLPLVGIVLCEVARYQCLTYPPRRVKPSPP